MDPFDLDSSSDSDPFDLQLEAENASPPEPVLADAEARVFDLQGSDSEEELAAPDKPPDLVDLWNREVAKRRAELLPTDQKIPCYGWTPEHALRVACGSPDIFQRRDRTCCLLQCLAPTKQQQLRFELCAGSRQTPASTRMVTSLMSRCWWRVPFCIFRRPRGKMQFGRSPTGW